MIKGIIIGLIAVCGAVVLLGCTRSRRPFLTVLFGAASGIVTLILLSAFGGLIGLKAVPNTFALVLSSLFGIPGAFLSAILHLKEIL